MKTYPKADIKIWLEKKSKTPLRIRSTLKNASFRLLDFSLNNKLIEKKDVLNKLK